MTKAGTGSGVSVVQCPALPDGSATLSAGLAMSDYGKGHFVEYGRAGQAAFNAMGALGLATFTSMGGKRCSIGG